MPVRLTAARQCQALRGACAGVREAGLRLLNSAERAASTMTAVARPRRRGAVDAENTRIAKRIARVIAP